MLYVVDVDENIAPEPGRASSPKKQGREPKIVTDMREAFDDKSVDIVTTATPNHWHALVSIWAMQAGKDVYVEKPVSHNVSEGRRIVEAARKYNRICQTGTQCRSNQGHAATRCKYVHDGKIGKVKVARGLCYKRRGVDRPAGQLSDSQGRELRPVARPGAVRSAHAAAICTTTGTCSFPTATATWATRASTRWTWPAGAWASIKLSDSVLSYGGRLGYEDAGDTANTQMIIHDYGDQALVFEVRGLETETYKDANVGVIFEGTDGYLVMTSYSDGAAFDKDGNKVQEFNGGGDHYGNFLQAVRSRKHEDLHADILEGHLSSALCHLGNISYRLGTQMSVAEVKERLQERVEPRARAGNLRAVHPAPGRQQARPGHDQARLGPEAGHRRRRTRSSSTTRRPTPC